jgi:hypothetical protein
MLGQFSEWAPWTLLHRYVPIFTSMRVPSRFRLIFHMFVALFVAYAIEYARKRSKRMHIFVVALAFIGIGDMIGFGFDIVKTRFHGPPPIPVVVSKDFYYGGIEVSKDFADAVRQNRGWLGCRSYEWPSNEDARVWTGNVLQARATDDSARVEKATRTSSTFSVDVDVKKPTIVLLNSGYAAGWQTTAGKIVEHDQMLAVELPVGYHKLRVRYWPRRMTPGIWITSIGLLGVIAFYVVRRLRRRR